MNLLVILKPANAHLKPITWLKLIFLRRYGPISRKENAFDEFSNTIKMEMNRFMPSFQHTMETEGQGIMHSLHLNCMVFLIRNILLLSNECKNNTPDTQCLNL